MFTVLVVDDSAVDRKLVGTLLDKSEISVEEASEGFEALEILHESAVDVVLTDLQMPEMDGLQLVDAVRSQYPLIPVVLMTAHGSEELAIEALARGAASYVPKQNLASEVVSTLKHVLEMAQSTRDHEAILERMISSHSNYVLENNPALVAPLVKHLEQSAGAMKLFDETGGIRLAIALDEALSNAVLHGNLELRSDELNEAALRSDGGASYRALVSERREKLPYRGRRVHVEARAGRTEAVYVVRDEGPGFDAGALPDPTDPTNLERLGGRGLLLIRTFMDEVTFNETGNEIRMVKHRDVGNATERDPGLIYE